MEYCNNFKGSIWTILITTSNAYKPHKVEPRAAFSKNCPWAQFLKSFAPTTTNCNWNLAISIKIYSFTNFSAQGCSMISKFWVRFDDNAARCDLFRLIGIEHERLPFDDRSYTLDEYYRLWTPSRTRLNEKCVPFFEFIHFYSMYM